jgi:hypothetical protein
LQKDFNLNRSGYVDPVDFVIDVNPFTARFQHHAGFSAADIDRGGE